MSDPADMMGRSIASELGGRLEELRCSVDDLRTSVEALQGLWQIRYETAIIRRKRAIFLLAVAVVAGMWLNDLHINGCVVDAYVAQQVPPAVCDVSHPLHTHGHRSEGVIVIQTWPTRWNYTGLALYATVIAVGWWWWRRPIPDGDDR